MQCQQECQTRCNDVKEEDEAVQMRPHRCIDIIKEQPIVGDALSKVFWQYQIFHPITSYVRWFCCL